MAIENLSDLFSQAAHWTAQRCGRASTFALACFVIIIWAASGPAFGFSDTWQLIINTGTTIITFLMVFLMQNTQNRDTAAIQLKLDELIRANRNARNAMLQLEDLTEEQLARLKTTFVQLAEIAAPAQDALHQSRQELEEAEERMQAAEARVQHAEQTIEGVEAATRRARPA